MKPFYYLSDFPERRRAGKNYIAECPKCGKKHLAISRDTGLYCCFYAGCDFHGKLKDFWTERRSTGWQDAGSPAGASPVAKGSVGKGEPGGMVSAGGGNAAFEVSMLPEDYKRLSPEVIAKIKPLTDDPETTDTGQLAARRYLADMGISLKTAIDARIGCLVHRCFGGKDSKDGKDKKNAAGMMYQCIAYVNYINGQPVNVKYRSCDATASGYTKCWSQDSPTTPCPPYNIDCINPLLIAEENIPRLIVTEGERDVLTLREAGYPYVISVPNGAASDLSKGFEAFRPWLDRVQELVICGDSDLPGRTLVKHLADYFGRACGVRRRCGARDYRLGMPASYVGHHHRARTCGWDYGRAERQLRPRLRCGSRPADRPGVSSYRPGRTDNCHRKAQLRQDGFSERPDLPPHGQDGA